MDVRWSKIVAQTNEQRIIWADNVLKLNRKDAKVRPLFLPPVDMCSCLVANLLCQIYIYIYIYIYIIH